VVKLRFFIGLSNRETARLLGISTRTVERHWSYAKAWLFERMEADKSVRRPFDLLRPQPVLGVSSLFRFNFRQRRRMP
jgi:hypothetical protein